MSRTTDQLYERVLVLRCQAGDELAFSQLVQLYQPRLRFYLRKMLHDLQRAEDAAQEVWLDVFRSVSRLSNIDAFRPWLYRIARDRAVTELRKFRLPCQPWEEVESGEEAAEEVLFANESTERIYASLDELTPTHREVLVLRYIEAMSYIELAEVVGCQVGTVRSRLHYAKRALRSILERKNIHD